MEAWRIKSNPWYWGPLRTVCSGHRNESVKHDNEQLKREVATLREAFSSLHIHTLGAQTLGRIGWMGLSKPINCECWRQGRTLNPKP